MERTNKGPDLTMLALAAYDAIRKSVEKDHGKQYEASRSAQPHDRTAGRGEAQTADCRLITI